MSELDVIVIRIRAGQAAGYERLLAGRELPRWRGYTERGAVISARISRAAFGAGQRDGIARYVIAVEVAGHAGPSQHDAGPRFREFSRLAGAFEPGDPLVCGGQALHAAWPARRVGVRAGCHEADDVDLAPDRRRRHRCRLPAAPGDAGNVTYGQSSGRLEQPRTRDTVVEHPAGYRMRRKSALPYLRAAPAESVRLAIALHAACVAHGMSSSGSAR
jgi:hypothetical protein